MLTAWELTVPGRLADVSTRLEPGRITAICGPNGAGKSTLLRCLAGLLTPESGLILLDGEPLSALPVRERARMIGYLPQQAQVAWDVSVARLVALGRLPHRDRGEAIVAQVMERLELTAFADRPVSTLSGGERARVLLARVLAGRPRWVLADEPLAALDLAHQSAILRHLRAAAEAGAGVVMVLHDLSLAANHADRVLIMSEGGLAADGMPFCALDPPVIERVWGQRVEWLGDRQRGWALRPL